MSNTQQMSQKELKQKLSKLKAPDEIEEIAILHAFESMEKEKKQNPQK